MTRRLALLFLLAATVPAGACEKLTAQADRPEAALAGTWTAERDTLVFVRDSGFRRAEVGFLGAATPTVVGMAPDPVAVTVTRRPHWRVLRDSVKNQTQVCLDAGGVGTETCAPFTLLQDTLRVNLDAPHARPVAYVRGH